MQAKLTTEVTLSQSGFLFDHSSGLTYTLNPTGQFIFRRIEGGGDPDDILPAVMEEFDVGEHVAKRDLDDFIRQLRELGILE